MLVHALFNTDNHMRSSGQIPQVMSQLNIELHEKHLNKPTYETSLYTTHFPIKWRHQTPAAPFLLSSQEPKPNFPSLEQTTATLNHFGEDDKPHPPDSIIHIYPAAVVLKVGFPSQTKKIPTIPVKVAHVVTTFIPTLLLEYLRR